MYGLDYFIINENKKQKKNTTEYIMNDFIIIENIINNYFNTNKIMIRIENYKNNKTILKQINVPQKFYDVYYVFSYIINNDDVKEIFNEKENNFFEHLKNPEEKIDEKLLTETNLQTLILFGNANLNIGIEIIGTEINFINNGEYVNLKTLQDIESLWKNGVINILNSEKGVQ